jgi:membrane protein
MGKWWGPLFGGTLSNVLDLTVSFGLLVAVFALIYKYIPRARIRWRDVWVGSTFTIAPLLFIWHRDYDPVLGR